MKKLFLYVSFTCVSLGKISKHLNQEHGLSTKHRKIKFINAYTVSVSTDWFLAVYSVSLSQKKSKDW